MSDRDEDELPMFDEREDRESDVDDEEGEEKEEDDDIPDEVILADGDIKEGALKREGKDRVTTPYLTKYERARILGTRALQISMNAPVLVDIDNDTDVDPLTLAQKELRLRVIPLIIRRTLPDGSYEDWHIQELEVDLDRPVDDRYTNL